MNLIEAFFRDLDARLTPLRVPRVELHIIGSTALFLQSSYTRGTKDCDAVETYTFDATVKAELLTLGGKDKAIAQHHGIYLDFIKEVKVFLPDDPCWTPYLTLNSLDLYTLDPTDVVVAKLIRLHRDDRRDIEAMVSRGLVNHARLVERFESAALRYGRSGQGDMIKRAIDNFHSVERDIFVVDESEIEIPDWMLE